MTSRRSFSSVIMLAAILVFAVSGALNAAPLPGAIFTTDSTCSGVDLNIYQAKDDVYVDGGPAHPGAAGLPDGYYYVKVTDPDGTLLGTSVGSGNEAPVHVTNGEFDQCYQLSAILIKASDGTAGYDDTANPGGEYKVWVSTVSTFDNDSAKTDNFKVKACVGDGCGGGGGGLEQATLSVIKFYDANANGVNDDNQPITGWKVRITDGIDLIRFTPANLVVDPDTYTVTESLPLEPNWKITASLVDNVPFAVPPTTSVEVTLGSGDAREVEFGNLCLGAGGGLTLGFWSNKNGQALFGSDDLALMVSLNLRDAAGNNFDPGTYAAFRTWLLNATAVNMAYMLSAQLAAMELNVLNGKVNGNSLVYAPGTTSANFLGYAKVSDLMAEANTELGLHGYTPSGSAFRSYQESLKNALDKANNNLNFVQPSPCAFTF